MSDASAQHDRAAILHRVSAAIWSASPDAPAMSWPTAFITARHPSQVALADAVERTKAEARAAVGALMIGPDGRHARRNGRRTRNRHRRRPLRRGLRRHADGNPRMTEAHPTTTNRRILE